MDGKWEFLSLPKSKDENQNYPPDILYPRLLVCIYQPTLIFDIRLFAYFNLLFLLIRAKLALKMFVENVLISTRFLRLKILVALQWTVRDMISLNQLALKYDVRTQRRLLDKIVYEVWRFFKESSEHNHIPIFNERS